MKKAMLFFTLSLMSYYSQAQGSKTITSVALQVNNSYQFTSAESPVHSFYGLGGQLTIYLKDKVYLGFSQLGSLAPSDLLESRELTPNKIRLYEYTINAGIKSKLGSNFYLLAGLRGGLGLISMGSTQKVDGFKEFLSKENTESFLVAPELKVGVQPHKYFALEAGVTYEKYFGSNEKWGIAPKDFDGFGGTFSLVGRLPGY